jgi:hypothetical protein
MIGATRIGRPPCIFLLSIAFLTGLLPDVAYAAPAAPTPPAPPKAVAATPDKTTAPKPLSQSLTGQAKADFEAAKLLANDGDFAGALIKFQSAYSASHDVRLLWNAAFCLKNLRHYAKVVQTLRRYIDEGATTLSAADKKDAQDLITTIEPFTTRVTLAVNAPGAEVFVDEEHVGTTPLLAPVVLDLGERRFRITNEGYTPYEKTVPVGGAADVTVNVALEREIHEGKLVIEAPAGASIFVDEAQVGSGKAELTVASGGHQLRVTAPAMRPYQTEVVVQDNEVRSLNVALEHEAPASVPGIWAPVARPTLRVAVGCGDTVLRPPDEGLVLFIDGPDVLPPTYVKMRWDTDAGRNVLDHVEYSVNPGLHTVRVAFPGCYGYDIRVEADPVQGADISGVLETDRGLLFRGPQGSPGWFHASLGLWLAGGNASANIPDTYASRGISVVGESLEVGAVSRWFGYYMGGSIGNGSFDRKTFNSNQTLPESAGVKWQRLALRFGPRFPFNVVSVGFGPKLGWEQIGVEGVRSGNGSAFGGAYAEVIFEPLCDWGLFLNGSADAPFNGDGVSGSTQFGFVWAPSPTCHRERETNFGLRGQAP